MATPTVLERLDHLVAAGTVATPDQDVVDEFGDALGVSRSPDEPFRPSSEILEARDRRRRAQQE